MPAIQKKRSLSLQKSDFLNCTCVCMQLYVERQGRYIRLYVGWCQEKNAILRH